jgi:hypothetical protein
MKETYLINLDPTEDDVLDYETADRNLGKIQVVVKGEKTPPRSEGYRVQITMSSDAMIGFGTSLIRKAMASRGIGSDPQIGSEPIEPISNGYLLDEIGMFLVPGSADLMIFMDEEMGTITDIVDKQTKMF